jgi:hypothetical protein
MNLEGCAPGPGCAFGEAPAGIGPLPPRRSHPPASRRAPPQRLTSERQPLAWPAPSARRLLEGLLCLFHFERTRFA